MTYSIMRGAELFADYDSFEEAMRVAVLLDKDTKAQLGEGVYTVIESDQGKVTRIAFLGEELQAPTR